MAACGLAQLGGWGNTAIETRGEEQVVTALVEGDFPKAGLPDPLRLEYRFRLVGGLISSLSIGLPRRP